MNIEELLAKINAWRTAYERWAGLDAQALYQTADYKEMIEAAEAVTGSAHYTRQYQVITTLADEIRRLQAIETRAVTINNALLAAIQTMMPFLTLDVQERMQQALQPVIDLMEQKP